MKFKVSHPTKIINCEINLPSSKSISNRLLIIQSLSKTNFKIKNLSVSDDTQVLYNSINSTNKVVNVKNAGTPFRFLTAFLALQKEKESVLTGSERLKKRPIKELVEALNKMGAKIKYIQKEGYAPIKISGSKLNSSIVEINGGISSQFISALLLIGPTLEKGIKIKITGEIVSKPYILMTLQLMREFKIKWTWVDNIITIKKQNYIGKEYTVESDWSAAAFWFQIASLSKNCRIQLNGLHQKSIQGDKRILDIFNSLGVKSVFKNNKLILTKKPSRIFPEKINLIENPDLYQPLKCTLFAKNINAKFSGTQTLCDKETDRINSVRKELKKLNASKNIQTYNDHRMAMSFAPLCLKFDELHINKSEVVSKSYPNFWKDLKKGGFTISALSD